MPANDVYIGKMNRRIKIQRREVVVNGYADQQESFTDVHECWAAVEYPLTGSSEGQFDAMRQAVTSAIFTVRNREVLFTDRIVYDCNNWNIMRIEELGLNNYKRITAERRL